MSRWYVVNTLPHQEARAEVNLRQQGYRPWLPSMKRVRRHARRVDTVAAPLFPGYLFVELDVESEAWGPINGTFGVRRLLCHRERPAPMPAGFVEALRQTADGDGFLSAPETLGPGQKVRLIAGPLVDCVGTLMHLASNGRVGLLLHLLGQDVSAVVSRRMLAPAD